MKTRFIGPYSSGKTTIINMLKEATDLSTDPTPVYKDQGSIELSFLGDVEERSLELDDEDREVPVTELGGQEKFWEKHEDDTVKFTADVDLIVGVFDLKNPEDEEEYREMLDSYSSYIESFLEASDELDRDIDWGFLVNRVERGDYNKDVYEERREEIEAELDKAFAPYSSDYVIEDVYGLKPRSARRAFFDIYFESVSQDKVLDDICEKISGIVNAEEVAIVNDTGVTLGSYSGDGDLSSDLDGVEDVFRGFDFSERDFAIFSDVDSLSESYLRPSSELEYDLVLGVQVDGEEVLVLVRTGMRMGATLLRLQNLKEQLEDMLSDLLEE